MEEVVSSNLTRSTKTFQTLTVPQPARHVITGVQLESKRHLMHGQPWALCEFWCCPPLAVHLPFPSQERSYRSPTGVQTPFEAWAPRGTVWILMLPVLRFTAWAFLDDPRAGRTSESLCPAARSPFELPLLSAISPRLPWLTTFPPFPLAFAQPPVYTLLRCW